MIYKYQASSSTINDLSMVPKISFGYSWFMIIFTLILFFPVGIYLMYKRFTIDRASSVENSRVLKFFVFLFSFCEFLYVIVALNGEPDMQTPIIVIGVIIAFLVYTSRKMRISGIRYKQYLLLVADRNQRSLDEIASLVGTSYEVVKKELENMLTSGYFAGAYIDNGLRTLVVPTQYKNQSYEEHIEYSSESYTNINTARQPENKPESKPESKPQYVVVSCKSCGANNNVLVGKVSHCEYCGSPIQIQ